MNIGNQIYVLIYTLMNMEDNKIKSLRERGSMTYNDHLLANKNQLERGVKIKQSRNSYEFRQARKYKV